jgi:regulator of sigma E protease
MYILVFIIILAALVFVHELGHFLAAKAAGIRVDEFAIGFPPKIFSFTKGETKYSLNLIPFGGFVKIFGEDNEDANNPALDPESRARSFVSKPKSIQAMVLVAGIIFNILFAWVLISAGFMMGLPVSEDYAPGKVQNPTVVITSVQNDSPAMEAGLKPGDKIVALNAEVAPEQKPTGEQVRDYIAANNNKPINFLVERVSGTQTISVTPELKEGAERPMVGIIMESAGILKLSFFPAIYEGGVYTYYVVKGTAVAIAGFIGGAFTGGSSVGDVTGPVGIAGLVNDATELGFVYILMFTAVISVNLAIINLIPFPALDGGRILFVGIEKVLGRPLNPKAVQIVNLVGLGMLLLLMVVVTFKDIFALF